MLIPSFARSSKGISTLLSRCSVRCALAFAIGLGLACLSAGAQPPTSTQIDNSGQITGTASNPDAQARIKIPTLDPVLELIGKPPTSFMVGGKFTLPAKSSAINPVKETVALQLSGYHIAVPPSSFVKTKGIYVYNGKIGKVALGMVIRPVGAQTYLFGIQGAGAKGLPSHYPVQFTLTIGNYTSTETINRATTALR